MGAQTVLALVLSCRPPTVIKFWGPIVGPFVAIISFVCSVGNIPLAAVLWNGGISFGGVVAFILADLIVLPILDIYRRYYGTRMSLFILLTFYFSMSLAALAIELSSRVSAWYRRIREEWSKPHRASTTRLSSTPCCSAWRACCYGVFSRDKVPPCRGR
jgi:hypothetical protein